MSALTLLALAAMGATSSPAMASCQSANVSSSDVTLCGRCGDGFCNPSCGENESTCPKDCGSTSVSSSDVALCGRCGDGFCNPSCGENESTCPKDCQGVPR